MKQSKRIFYYDVLRAIAIIGIVFCHASISFVSKPNMMNLNYFIISSVFDCFRDFSIPIFVMLSGALLIGKKDTLTDFFKRRLSRLFIPFIFWVVIYAIYSFIFIRHSIDLNYALDIFLGAPGTLGVAFWFVWMIVLSYVGIFIINKAIQWGNSKYGGFDKKFISLLTLISLLFIACVSYSLFNPYSSRIVYFVSFLTYIVIGYFIANYSLIGETAHETLEQTAHPARLLPDGGGAVRSRFRAIGEASANAQCDNQGYAGDVVVCAEEVCGKAGGEGGDHSGGILRPPGETLCHYIPQPQGAETEKQREKHVLTGELQNAEYVKITVLRPVEGQIEGNLRKEGEETQPQQVFPTTAGVAEALYQQKTEDGEGRPSHRADQVVNGQHVVGGIGVKHLQYQRCSHMVDEHGHNGNPLQGVAGQKPLFFCHHSVLRKSKGADKAGIVSPVLLYIDPGMQIDLSVQKRLHIRSGF